MTRPHIFRSLTLLTGFALAACQTVPDASPIPGHPTKRGVAQPVALPPAPPVAKRPPPPVDAAPEESVLERPSMFAALEGWEAIDAVPALEAFRRSCRIWEGADDGKELSPRLPQYGTFADWRPACRMAGKVRPSQARAFFEAQFRPVTIVTPEASDGLLTGYYEPELDVRRVADAEFSEPILARPKTDKLRLQPRSKISEATSRVIAYGRPADVFFMQIQGSGRIRFPDGLNIRAAFAGHNGHPYTSIGRKLIEWGELSKSKASKGAIEAWMADAGPMRTKSLMNENARYIFFEEQSIPENTGPNGAMRVPLTDMGSVAVDPRYHPYGTVALLSTRVPARPGDYKGEPRHLLVVGQDTGGAIKGPLRADLFFGAGEAAGKLAGVMKHRTRWTLLLPKAIAPDMIVLGEEVRVAEAP